MSVMIKIDFLVNPIDNSSSVKISKILSGDFTRG